jgi:hypothetical protein
MFSVGSKKGTSIWHSRSHTHFPLLCLVDDVDLGHLESLLHMYVATSWKTFESLMFVSGSTDRSVIECRTPKNHGMIFWSMEIKTEFYWFRLQLSELRFGFDFSRHVHG